VEKIRIQKWLSQLEICSRREAEKWISEGRVEVNGRTVRDLATRVDPATDKLVVDGKPVKTAAASARVSTAPLVYWLFHKPAGYSLEKKPGVPDIFALPRLKKLKFKVSPATALPKNAEGLCLLSNDLEFVRGFRLCEDSEQVVLLMIDRRLEDEEMRAFADEKEAGSKRPALKVEYRHKAKLGATTGYWYFIQGKVPGLRKRIDKTLLTLKAKTHKYVQLSLAGMELPETLKPGEYIQLAGSEIRRLKRQIRKNQESPEEKSTKRT
jgi:16S rRNA U516 pseudouridylate synthase RsuA-like enzyme